MRNRVRKNNIGQFSDEQMERAVKLILENKISLRRAADECNVSFVTLFRYVKKQKAANDEGSNMKIRFTHKYNSRLIFTAELEKLLSEYLLICSKMCYGKSTRDTRELANEMAMINEINVPPSWHVNSAAGLDWLRGFLKRNTTLSKRQPEKCSLSRCTSFYRLR
ncbi:uncharacterized protein LOC126892213 isoform X2 [Diabrotica virgifera virgifera]|uniref:HTH psq-type domain-containing protein n=1 Tax=Diabrotica virgifera virgifera TaxID=50390 RepID=A0ABM5KDM2_DIAVI|nr:uncharacterized protein LOC126885653 [Diabrotica virgifera virgifera]XP_050517677.1 uncharacterized protein LOC126892213 isoform X2 [Diabrotica virgifera virgifera]